MKLPFLKKKKEELAQIFETKATDVTDIIAPSSIEIASSHMKFGKRLAKSFFIFSYPRYLSAGWLSPIINLDTPMDVSIFVHPIETGQVLKQLRKRVTEVQAEIAEREEKGLIRDPALETAYQDLEQLRDRLQTAQERMFRFGLYLTIYGNEEKELREVETNLRSILESRLIYIKPALYQQKEAFDSSSPYGLDKLMVHTTMNTGPLSSTFPFVSFDLSSNEGILYGVNRHNNSLILFDRFSLENANSILFSKSGAGKSILGDENVLIRNKGKIQLAKIGPLIEQFIKKYGATKIDEELEGTINPGIEVYSFNKNLQGEWSRVTIAARKKAPKTLYRFTTQSGRTVTTTGDHNMVILKEGRVIATKGSEIKKGEYVPLPKSVSSQKKTEATINLLNLLKNADKIYLSGGENLIKVNYSILKKMNLDKRLDRYLYKYRGGRVVPIKYFWKIIKSLKIGASDLRLRNVKVTSKNGKDRILFDGNFKVTSGLMKLLGYITAEGTVRENCVMITNLDAEVLKDIDIALKSLKVPFYYANKGIVIASRVFVEMVKALAGKQNSKQKEVPAFIFSLRKERVSQFLSAYFEGDGGVECTQIVASSKSKRLISEISYLLYYFGIIGRIVKTKKKATNSNWQRKRTYWKITISGQDNVRSFSKNINFISRRKRKRLSEIIQKEGNTNVNVIPKTAPVLKEIRQLFGFQLHGIQELSNLSRGHYNPSPEKLREIIKIIEERIQKFKDSASTFKILGELPELATIINLGKEDKELNSQLWKTLGWDWGLMKSQRIQPKISNVLKALRVINGNSYPLVQVKDVLHAGFQEMDLLIKYHNPSLQGQLASRKEENTRYTTIQKAAQYTWQNYQDILTSKLPQVEAKLSQLKLLANSDIFWDPIIETKKINNKKEKYVYDLTVDNEVFLAGQGGMFVHNSYAVKLEILRSLMLGVDSIIIDPENEYQYLSDAVGGSFFNMSLASPNHINPFDLPKPTEDEKPADILRSNIINMVGLLRLMLGGLSAEEDAIIDRALSETYAAKDITPESDPNTWPEKIPLMSDFEKVLESMEGAESLVRRVRKFTKGTFAQFFNQPTNISMDKPFVVFGIRDMEDELRPMAMFIIMRYIWNKVRSELKKRILVVDEAWWLMQTEDGASFLYGICKRARKYWLGVTTITQDVGDFMKSDYGRPIITNSSLQILLKQSPATMDVVQKTFNLTEEEKYLLLEAEVGEGIFFAGQKHVAIKVVASYTEDQIITSSPEEIVKIRKAKEKVT